MIFGSRVDSGWSIEYNTKVTQHAAQGKPVASVNLIN